MVRRRRAAGRRALLFGSVALAVSLRRAGRVPAALAIGLPLTWLAALPLSMVGGGIVAGACWLVVASRTAQEA
ncbi:hypothetical protein [Conexibacter sp. SYSU D00693]|uniref:hypothetical protein n=1 Tax=Conexibacter sp. SYSU D00693 TaxID=2812560 RepID=UPI00196B9DCF|nr:hypothetical protein [Conexibacter sp. SYSU D00693]